jgi:hydrogenase maturation protein HypF
MALAHLWQSDMEWEADLPPAQALCSEERTALRGQLEHHLNTPLTSSMGRFLDAASALIGVRQKITYEGQAAIELEALADPQETGVYPFERINGTLDPAPFWQALLADWRSGTPLPRLSARIHNSVVQMVVETSLEVRKMTGLQVVALSGGVWQNIFILQRVRSRLESEGFRVFVHHQVPANDGCIALGQVMVAASQTGS